MVKPLFDRKQILSDTKASGKADIVLDQEIKRSVAKQVDYFQHFWKGVDDPEYALIETKIDAIEYMITCEFVGKKYQI